jgi:hypothetical protein
MRRRIVVYMIAFVTLAVTGVVLIERLQRPSELGRIQIGMAHWEVAAVFGRGAADGCDYRDDSNGLKAHRVWYVDGGSVVVDFDQSWKVSRARFFPRRSSLVEFLFHFLGLWKTRI